MGDLYEVEDTGNWWDPFARYVVRCNGFCFAVTGTLSGAYSKIASDKVKRAWRNHQRSQPRPEPNIVYRSY